MLDKTLIKRDVLVRFCEQYGLGVSGDTEALAIAFEAYIHANVPLPIAGQPYPENYQVMCDVCGGDSSVNDDCCPYCGSSGQDEGPAPADAQLAIEPVVVTSATKVKGKKRSEKKTNGKSAVSLVDVVAPETPEVMATPEPEVDTAVDAVFSKGSSAPYEPRHVSMGDRSPITALALRGAMEEITADNEPVTIEAAITAVLDAKKLHVASHWHFGRAILRCFENDLWKQVRNDKGNPKYKGFAAFCESELKLASRYCYTLMEISAQFGAGDVADIGVAKLGQILKVAPAQRTKLLEQARDGKPLSDIAKQVQELVKKNGPSGAGSGKKDTSKARDAAARKANELALKNADLITCTHEKLKVRVELFKTTKTGNPARAKRLGDKPVGAESTMNGLTIKYSVTTDAKGQLVLIVERVRPA